MIYWDGHSFNACEETSRCPQHRTQPKPRNEPTFFTRGGKKYLVPPATHRCTREEVEHYGSCEWAARAEDEGWEFAEEAPKKPAKTVPRNITVYYMTSDRYRETRKFKTLSGAQAYAQKKIGKTPEMGTHYAVSGYGTAKIEVSGASLKELFPET